MVTAGSVGHFQRFTNMSYYLFLDDERKPAQVTWVNIPRDQIYSVVRNYKEFVAHIEQFGIPAFVTFDHDLADEHYKVMLEEVAAQEKFTTDVNGMNMTFHYGPEKTGYDCAKWLVDWCADRGLKFPEFAVHSMNPVGAARIREYIANAKRHLDI